MRLHHIACWLLLSLPGIAFSAPPGEEERIRKERESLEKATLKYETPLNFGFDLSYSPRKFSNYQYVPGLISDKVGYAVAMRFEWLALKQYGKLGIGLGSGVSVHPNIVIVAGSAGTEDQVATLYTIPIEVSLTYRADFVRNQILVPYGSVGMSLTLLKQSSSFGYSRSGLQTFKGLEFGAGIQFNLNTLETSAARSLDQSIGINNSQLFAEYHVVNSMGTAIYDLSRKEWRFGIRFEF